jgi:tetratricopeptide (TPR) repeat protein
MQTGDMQYSSKNYLEAEKIYRAMLAQNDQDDEAWGSLALALRAQEKHASSAAAFAREAENSKDEMRGYSWYSAAVEFAKAGSKDKAVESLEKAFATGYEDHGRIEKEPALASIATDPRVRQLLAKQ